MDMTEGWANTDLAFLSSLTCSGYTVMAAPSSISSLTGLDNVVDGLLGAYTSNIIFNFLGIPKMTNVSALNAYARCGTPTQRPDGPDLPTLTVGVQGCADALASWAALCNYMLYGVCPGTPAPPQPPPSPVVRATLHCRGPYTKNEWSCTWRRTRAFITFIACCFGQILRAMKE
jgi:hypothetical protein